MRALCRCVCAGVIAATAFACGGDPPEREMQQAEGAIAAARAAGADQYAHDEFAAAENALKNAHEAVNDHDYRLALNHALDARERAENAAREAADHKASARVDADRTLRDASAALEDARARLKAAEGARIPPKGLAEVRRTIQDGEERLQKARAAFDQGDYRAATDGLSDVSSRVRASARELEAAAAPPARRRR